MVTRQTLVVVGVVLMATLAVVVPAVSAAPAASGDDSADLSTMAQPALQTDENATANASANESDFGNQMTAFMQSNAAQTEDTVENGMWESAFERANESKKARLAHQRADELDDKLAELREANRTLYERYQNGSISRDEFVARASELSGRIEALEEGVDGTARAAKQAGVNASALNELRENARNLSGPKVAGIARNLTSGDGGPPASIPGRGPPGENGTDRPGGPPEDAPGGQNAGPGNGTDGANVTTGPQAGPNGPQGTDAGNETRGPGASGNGNDDSPGAGQGDGGPGGNDGGDGASGSGNSGDGNSGDGPPGNSGPEDDPSGNDDGNEGAPGNGNGGDGDDGDAGGESDGDDNAGGSGGNENAGSDGGGSGNGGAPSVIPLTDILFSH